MTVTPDRGSGPSGVAVQLIDMHRSYGPVRALDGLSIDIAPGELVALLGPSGCGKTTALRALGGLDDLDAGQILVDGRDITHMPSNKRDMGIVFQAHRLFPNMTARDNVAYGLRLRGMNKDERNKRAGEMLELVGLATQSARYPHQMSGGQQQRVALARALAIEPRCCSSTNRSRPSTPRSGVSCVRRSGGSRSWSARRRCSSPTTRRRRWPLAIASA